MFTLGRHRALNHTVGFASNETFRLISIANRSSSRFAGYMPSSHTLLWAKTGRIRLTYLFGMIVLAT